MYEYILAVAGGPRTTSSHGCGLYRHTAAGNIATEDLVYMLARGGFETSYDLDALIATARWIGEVLGRPAPSALSRAGGFPRA